MSSEHDQNQKIDVELRVRESTQESDRVNTHPAHAEPAFRHDSHARFSYYILDDRMKGKLDARKSFLEKLCPAALFAILITFFFTKVGVLLLFLCLVGAVLIWADRSEETVYARHLFEISSELDRCAVLACRCKLFKTGSGKYTKYWAEIESPNSSLNGQHTMWFAPIEVHAQLDKPTQQDCTLYFDAETNKPVVLILSDNKLVWLRPLS